MADKKRNAETNRNIFDSVGNVSFARIKSHGGRLSCKMTKKRNIKILPHVKTPRKKSRGELDKNGQIVEIIRKEN